MQWRNRNRGHQQLRAEMLEAVLLGTRSGIGKNEHLRACTSCASEAKELASVMALLDEWQAPEPSPYFDTRLRARLRAEPDNPKPAWRLTRSMTFGWWFASISLFTGFLIIYGFLVAARLPVSTQSVNETSAVVDLQSLDRDADLLSEMDWLESVGSESE